jgi:hypothetical protein
MAYRVVTNTGPDLSTPTGTGATTTPTGIDMRYPPCRMVTVFGNGMTVYSSYR